MKKKQVFVNLVSILLIILCFEFFIWKKLDDGSPFLCLTSFFDTPTVYELYESLTFDEYYGNGNAQEEFKFRRPVGLKYKNSPVVIFGCSYAWGARLYEKQTFHYKLSELMKRPVYNRAISGWGVQHMLYQLKSDDFYADVPKPEYVVYVYISHHIKRMYKYAFNECCYYLKYDQRFGKLVEEKKLQNIPYLRIYQNVILPCLAELSERNNKKSFNLFEKHLFECKKEIDEHWGKNAVKFIILDYEGEDWFNTSPNLLNEKNVQKLAKDGITVVKTSQLTDVVLGKDYWLDEKDCHPNEKAWNLITPLFVEYLKKNNI